MDKIWSDFENYNQCEVPMCLKVLLWKCGYDTILSLKYMCEEKVVEMENHIQKYREKILIDSDECLSGYKYQEIFHFLPGHRNILLDLPQSIRKMQEEYTLQDDGSSSMESTRESIANCSQMTTEYSVILNALINTANMNKNKSKNAYQYADTIKYFSTYVFLLCGRTCYETLNKNLPIPSTKTIRKWK